MKYSKNVWIFFSFIIKKKFFSFFFFSFFFFIFFFSFYCFFIFFFFQHFEHFFQFKIIFLLFVHRFFVFIFSDRAIFHRKNIKSSDVNCWKFFWSEQILKFVVSDETIVFRIFSKQKIVFSLIQTIKLFWFLTRVEFVASFFFSSVKCNLYVTIFLIFKSSSFFLKKRKSRTFWCDFYSNDRNDS